MLKTILGTKKEMLSKYDAFGRQIPVTLIAADSNVVASLKENKVVLAFGRRKKIKRGQNALAKSLGYSPRIIKEAKVVDSSAAISVGDKVSVSIFEPGDLVRITGTTRGKGFAGGVKRWGFAGGPKTHGQSDRHRAPGSIGAGTTPGRVFRGKKMAGHMGNAKLTVTNLEVIEVDTNNNLIAVKGSVPGSRDGLLIIEKTGKAKVVKAPEVQKVTQDEEVTKEPEESKEPKASGAPVPPVTSDANKEEKKEGEQNAS
jgi:large subunit ribosomal protein L3